MGLGTMISLARATSLLLIAVCLFGTAARSPAEQLPTSVFAQRIAASEDLSSRQKQLSAEGTKLLEKSFAESQRLGRQLSLSEMRAVLMAADGPIKPNDYNLLTVLFFLSQRPPVTKPALRELQRNARSALENVEVKYIVAEKRGSELVLSSACSFAQSGSKRFLSMSMAGKRYPGVFSRHGFDGKSQRDYSEQNGETIATIRQQKYLRSFYPGGHPLVECGLVDGPETSRPYSDMNGLLERFGCLEIPEQFDGNECLIMGSAERAYYLAKKYDYALLGHQTDHKFDLKKGRLVTSASRATTHFSGHVRFAAGLWLPKRIERTYFTGEFTRAQTIITVHSWNVGTKPPNSLFTDIIPPGAKTLAVENDGQENPFR